MCARIVRKLVVRALIGTIREFLLTKIVWRLLGPVGFIRLYQKFHRSLSIRVFQESFFTIPRALFCFRFFNFYKVLLVVSFDMLVIGFSSTFVFHFKIVLCPWICTVLMLVPAISDVIDRLFWKTEITLI